MVDCHTSAIRSYNMSQIRSTDTTPELIVQRLVYSLGYRYRLHKKGLPGKPDLVFSGRRKVIFVHGCFWHRHTCKNGRSMPATRVEYWKEKFGRNKQRDAEARRKLKRLGWSVCVIWECQARKKLDMVNDRIVAFLEA